MKISTLKELHKAFHASSHADRTAAIENCQKVLEKAAALEPAVMGPVHAFLKGEIARHMAMQAHHANAMAECEKTESDELEKSGDGAADFAWLNKLIDGRVSEILDTVQPPVMSKVAPNRPGVTLVHRFGQPEPAKPNVPQEFAKLCLVDEDDQA